MTGVRFVSNTAQLYGGGVYADGSLSIESSHLEGNTCLGATCRGGGLYTGASLTATNTSFLTNTAAHIGGGAYAVGVAVVQGGHFQGNTCTQTTCLNGGLFAQSSLAVSGTTFLANAAQLGSGGAYAQGTTTIQNALFQANTCAQPTCQGAGLAALSTLLLTDTQFLSNTSQYDGGGVSAGGATTIDGSLFQGNACLAAFCRGAGLSAGFSAVMSGTAFVQNAAQYGGGGLYAQGSVTAANSIFAANTTTQLGGLAGGLATQGNLTLTDTHFLSNSTQYFGGGAIASGASLVSGGVFQNNACLQANCLGGGLHAATLTLSGTQFLSNSAQLHGAGAYAGSAIVRGGVFENNQCQQITCTGGGLYIESSLALTGTQFRSNSAGAFGGGLFYTGTASGRLVNALFAANHAGAAGSALASLSSGSLVLLHTTVASPTLASGSALAVLSGSVGVTNSLIASYTVSLERLGGSAWQDYNLFAGVLTPTIGAVGGGTHSLSGAAGFVAPNSGDYHLGPASAAINRGTDAGVTTDFEGEPRPQNGGFDAGFDESPYPRQPFDYALTISKSDGQTLVPAGAALTYTIVITNTGTDPAIDAVVSDTLPTGLLGGAWTCAASPGSSCPASGAGSLNEGVTVAAGGTLTFSLHATTTAQVAYHLVNTATVTTPDAAVSSASDVTIVSPQVSVTITKTDGVTQVVNGAWLTYTLVLSNAGPDAATGVAVTDTLPAGLTGATWSCLAGPGSTCPANGSGSLAATVTVTAGSAVTFTLQATTSVSATHTITNTASFSLPPPFTNTAPGPASAADLTEVVVAPPQYRLYLPLSSR
jgi:uncharacterized repeat protein (TIGR01451 family)